RVRQSTGEEWTNTSLTLSTVISDLVAKQIPQLRPVRLRPQPSAYNQGNVGFPQQQAKGGVTRSRVGWKQAPLQQQMMQSAAAPGGYNNTPRPPPPPPPAPQPGVFGSAPAPVSESE